MSDRSHVVSRRCWIQSAVGASLGGLSGLSFARHGIAQLGASTSGRRKAQIAITLDLEMSRNFPRREDLHWDYEKGNLNDATKQYAVDAGQRVKDHGGRIHYFCVGRVLEQPDVAWLRRIADDGHPIGNHTYDHVNLLLKSHPTCSSDFSVPMAD
jgi:hypothetical protein